MHMFVGLFQKVATQASGEDTEMTRKPWPQPL